MPKYRLTVEYPTVDVWEVEAESIEAAREAVFEYDEGTLIRSSSKKWRHDVLSCEEVK